MLTFRVYHSKFLLPAYTKPWGVGCGSSDDSPTLPKLGNGLRLAFEYAKVRRFYRANARIGIFAGRKTSLTPRSTLAAYALAHEVGHILLRSDPAPHSPQGLMRAEWGFAEYQRISHGALKFTQREAAAMRAALAAPSGFSHDFLCLAQRIGPR